MNILGIRGPSLTSNRSYAISPSVPIGLAYIIGAISDLDHVNIQVIDALLEKPSVVDLTKYNDELFLVQNDERSLKWHVIEQSPIGNTDLKTRIV